MCLEKVQQQPAITETRESRLDVDVFKRGKMSALVLNTFQNVNQCSLNVSSRVRASNLSLKRLLIYRSYATSERSVEFQLLLLHNKNEEV